MAGERNLPGLGLLGFYDLGDDTWKDGMDSNLRTLSALVARGVVSRVTALPATPTLGDIYIVPSGAGSNPNEIAIWDGAPGSEAWVYLTPIEGMRLYVADEKADAIWDGTVWLSSLVSQEPITATAYTVLDSDLLTGVEVKKINDATGCAITVPPSLSNRGICTFVQTGAGPLTFAPGAGVTINSADGNLSTRVQFSSASLIPDTDTADTFYLVGDLA